MTKTVDDWIRGAPEPQRAQLERLRHIILCVAPDAVEALRHDR